MHVNMVFNAKSSLRVCSEEAWPLTSLCFTTCRNCVLFGCQRLSISLQGRNNEVQKSLQDDFLRLCVNQFYLFRLNWTMKKPVEIREI